MRRCAEVYLEGQERSFAATETRARSLLGWDVVGIAAITGQMLTRSVTLPALAAALILLLSAVFSCAVLWPTQWHHSGQRPVDFNNLSMSTEYDMQRVLAGSYQAAIDLNATVTRRAKIWMRLAWCAAFASAPVGLVIHFI